jgi:hypothetical protein
MVTMALPNRMVKMSALTEIEFMPESVHLFLAAEWRW